ncbi:MAG: peptidylprolyl isomerase [Terriglobia bacterium]
MQRLGTLFLLFLVAAAGTARPQGTAEREPGLYATLDTSMGKIVIKLFEKDTPQTVENFVGLATGQKLWTHPGTRQRMVGKRYYDGVIFHRVIPNFMIQTGDPTGTGTGEPGYTIPDEFLPGLRFDRPGRVGMANAGPNTGGSQFFIAHTPLPSLNGKHTIFGQVVEGQSVVVAIGNVPRDPRDKPRAPVTINKVTIERVAPAPADASQ